MRDRFSKIIMEDKIKLCSSSLLCNNIPVKISPFCIKDMKIILPFLELKKDLERSCTYKVVVETLSIRLWKVTKSLADMIKMKVILKSDHKIIQIFQVISMQMQILEMYLYKSDTKFCPYMLPTLSGCDISLQCDKE